jgi:hypothetical protein
LIWSDIDEIGVVILDPKASDRYQRAKQKQSSKPNETVYAQRNRLTEERAELQEDIDAIEEKLQLLSY